MTAWEVFFLMAFILVDILFLWLIGEQEDEMEELRTELQRMRQKADFGAYRGKQ